MSNRIVHLFILDSSGSMENIKQSIIEMFNEQIRHIRNLADQHDSLSYVGLVVFGSSKTPVDVKFIAEPVDELKPLNNNIYQPYGSTPMNDAIGIGITQLTAKIGYYFHDTLVRVTIFTDGYENSSRKYTYSQISDLIKEYQEEYGWEFNFVGANIDVDELGKTLNISKENTIAFVADDAGVQAMSAQYSDNLTAYYSNLK